LVDVFKREKITKNAVKNFTGKAPEPKIEGRRGSILNALLKLTKKEDDNPLITREVSKKTKKLVSMITMRNEVRDQGLVKLMKNYFYNQLIKGV